jgi:hypothetical protein
MELLNRNVLEGYGDRDHYGLAEYDLFHAMGYHAGSEVLADAEFSIIHQFFTERYPDLVKALKKVHVEIHGNSQPAFAWVVVHSGHADAVEQDHFAAAVIGIEKALENLNTVLIGTDTALEAVKAGFKQFAAEHEMFFAM